MAHRAVSPGVIRMVQSGGKPVQVPDKALDKIGRRVKYYFHESVERQQFFQHRTPGFERRADPRR